MTEKTQAADELCDASDNRADEEKDDRFEREQQRAMIEDMEILIVPIAIELVLRILCVIVIAFGHFHHAHFEPDVASPGGSIPPIVVVERNLLDGAVLHISEHFGRNNELGP